MGIHYREDNIQVLKNPQKLTAFVELAQKGEIPMYFESQKLKPQKFSEKVVGEDFEKRVIDRKDRDALVLVYHPITEKNRGLK